MDEKVIDLDLDIYNHAKSIKDSDTESLLYVRTDGDELMYWATGDLTRIANSLVELMKEDYFLYETIDTALNIYEENKD